MSGLLADLHLLRPAWLALIPVLPLLLWLRRGHRQGGAWQRHCDPALFAYLGEAGPAGGRRGLLLLVLVGWLLAVLALAGPAWERVEMPVYRSAAARVLVLDLSRSMDAPDVVPSRLVRARFKAADLLSRSADGMVGLVVFAGDAHAIAPLTEDVNTLLNLLPPLETELMPVQGSRADLGIELAVELLERGGAIGGDILLITDGAPPAAQDAARRAREAGHQVAVLAVGTTSGAPIPEPGGGFFKDQAGNIVVPGVDSARLLAVAEAGGGRYATLSPDDSDIDRLLRRTDIATRRAAREDQGAGLRFEDRGPWLLLALLPLAALGFRRGWLLGAAGAALLLPPPPVMALDWSDLWLRPEQQVRAALEAGDTDAALAAAADAPADWLGAARYRGGDFAAAAEAFATGDGAVTHYNRGNALARAGRLEEALAAYDTALDRSPDLDDAVFNRELVRQLLDMQEQQEQQNGDPGEDGEQSPNGAGNDGEPRDTAGAGEDTGAGDPQAGVSGTNTEDGPGEQTPVDNAAGNTGEADAAARAGDAPAPNQPAEDGQSQADSDGDTATTETGSQSATAGDGTSSSDGQGLDPEQQARAEQMLRRVPDDPGGLLRRKFALEHVRRAGQRDNESQPW